MGCSDSIAAALSSFGIIIPISEKLQIAFARLGCELMQVDPSDVPKADGAQKCHQFSLRLLKCVQARKRWSGNGTLFRYRVAFLIYLRPKCFTNIFIIAFNIFVGILIRMPICGTQEPLQCEAPVFRCEIPEVANQNQGKIVFAHRHVIGLMPSWSFRKADFFSAEASNSALALKKSAFSSSVAARRAGRTKETQVSLIHA